MKRISGAFLPAAVAAAAVIVLGFSMMTSADSAQTEVKGNVPVTFIPNSEITFDADGNYEVTYVADPSPVSENGGQEIGGNLLDEDPETYEAINKAAEDAFSNLPVYRYEEYYIAHEGAVAQYDQSGKLIRVRGDCEYYSTLDQYTVNGSLPNGRYIGTYMEFTQISG